MLHMSILFGTLQHIIPDTIMCSTSSRNACVRKNSNFYPFFTSYFALPLLLSVLLLSCRAAPRYACPNDLQPQTWEDAFNLTTIAAHMDDKSAITLGTLNANALLTHVQQAAASECDILAIQEVRICKEQVPTIRATLKEYGYNFFHGILPQVRMQGHQKRSLHVDQLVPGTAFIVKEHIPIHEVPIASMSDWYNRGRILSLNAFINNRWITIVSGYAPVQDSNTFLDELASVLHNWAHQDFIFLGDINQDPKEGMFVKEMQAYGWLPLTMCTDYDFTTYLHPKGGQSTIDTIIVSDSLRDMISPVKSLQILDKGHKMIYANVFFETKQEPTREPLYNGKFTFEPSKSNVWQNAFEEHINRACNTSIDEDWSSWCYTLKALHNPQGSIIGDVPTFRIRDLSRKNKLITQLSQATYNGNWHSHDVILHKIKQISHNQLRKWKNESAQSNNMRMNGLATFSNGLEIRSRLSPPASPVKDLVVKGSLRPFIIRSVKSLLSFKTYIGHMKLTTYKSINLHLTCTVTQMSAKSLLPPKLSLQSLTLIGSLDLTALKCRILSTSQMKPLPTLLTSLPKL